MSPTSTSTAGVLAGSFSSKLFLRHLRTAELGRRLHWLNVTESTMRVGQDLLDEAFPFRAPGPGAPPPGGAAAVAGLLIGADSQTAGVARTAGRSWDSAGAGATEPALLAPGNPDAGSRGNLYVTLLLVVPRPETLMQMLPAAASATVLAARDALRSVTGSPAGLGTTADGWSGSLEPVLKWPNDVWIGGRKCAGMLARSSMLPNGAGFGVMIGVGINVNNVPEVISSPSAMRAFSSRPTSLREQAFHAPGSGDFIPRELVLASFLNHLEDLLSRPMAHTITTMQGLDCAVGRRLLISPSYVPHSSTPAPVAESDRGAGAAAGLLPPGAFEAIGMSISPLGELVVRNTATGQVTTLASSEEISIRPMPGSAA
ncbi:hypothetical protein H696_02400 [Fonticula alba]|uniref:BPL/LPL catalytic domain-containing protein n=1 Tax=Fonticula alba TaxID=691883 RepID=A0A058ZAL7_FONAL|nr:hypothetical protein H696_02400 [Fonticula alba]KCV71454.1 hypothetical protein H696_02400 [Fonticula alba]|eukprot:XP_009494577.1 hypothetical protein H696_02400 [Fonticula alba]